MTVNVYADDTSCYKEVGKEAASVNVKQCIDVSPATHPPCNDTNPCRLILDEIKRGCVLLIDDKNSPDFCKQYVQSE